MNEKLLSKIKNLLARADQARNDNENEREIALRQAESLMAKHAISHLDLSNEAQRQTVGALTDTTVARRTRELWPLHIMHNLCPLYRCRLVKLGGNRVHLFGHRTNIDIMLSMSDYCVKSIRREMSTAYNAQPGFKSNRRRFNTSFGNGASVGIKRQVSQMIAQRDRGDIPEIQKSSALIVVDQYKHQQLQVNNQLGKAYPRLRKGTGSRSTNAAGYHAGKRYGSSMNLGGQLGGKSPSGQLI